MDYVIGLDIGGTKIAAIVINQYKEICYRSEVPSHATGKEEMFKQVVRCVEDVLRKSNLHTSEVLGIGVGIPGKIDRENGIAVYQNNLPWSNFPVVDRLKDYFSIKKVTIDNDVYMAALAEWNISDLQKEDSFVFVTVSTGISCAIINQGTFMRGAGFAGEIGLFPVVSKLSPNGYKGLEKAASGPAMEMLAREMYNGPEMTTTDVFQGYHAGNEKSKQVVNEAVTSLAHGIYSIICLVDPNKIVFGGGVMNNNPYLLELIKDEIKQYMIPEQYDALKRMHVSHYKENAGVIGAGMCALMNENEMVK